MKKNKVLLLCILFLSVSCLSKRDESCRFGYWRAWTDIRDYGTYKKLPKSNIIDARAKAACYE